MDHLKEAITLAARHVAEGGGGPFGCIITHEGRIVGRGVNRVTALDDPTAHAEILAIREACQTLGTHSLEGCTLYATCEPCPMCLGAIYWARIDRVIAASRASDAADAGFDDAHFYREIRKEPGERDLQVKLDLRKDALDLFRVWKASDDAIPY